MAAESQVTGENDCRAIREACNSDSQIEQLRPKLKTIYAGYCSIAFLMTPNSQDADAPLSGMQTTVKNAFEAPQWYFSNLNYRILVRMKTVAEMTRDLEFERCLDIGCGGGSMSLQLLKPGRRITLQDLSEAMLERARASVPAGLEGNVETVAGDFLQVKLPAAGYGVVICLGVLSYVENLEPFLAKVHSLVAPGGHLIIECTDAPHFLSRLSGAVSNAVELVRKPKVNISLQKHSRARVWAVLQKLGLTLVGQYCYSAPPPVIRRFLSQEFHFKMNRMLHGQGGAGRLNWLGTECIFHFAKPAARP